MHIIKSIKKGNIKNIRLKLLLILSISISLLLTAVSHFSANGFIMVNQKKNELQKVKEAIYTLKKEALRLDTEIDTLKNGNGGIEKIAREKLGMAGRGEVVYDFVKTDVRIETN